ncbi:hypothetical protein J6590_057532, partial [Homalodisca vitripennis]
EQSYCASRREITNCIELLRFGSGSLDWVESVCTYTRACVGKGAMLCASRREITNYIELLRFGSESLDWVESARTLVLVSARVWKRELRLGCEYTDTRACVGEGLSNVMCVASRNNKLYRVAKVWKRELRLGCEYTDTRACVGEALVLGAGVVVGRTSKENSEDTPSKLTSGFLKTRSAGRDLSYSSSFGSEDFDSPDIPSDFHARFGINKTWGIRTPHPILSRRASFEDYGRPRVLDNTESGSYEDESSSVSKKNMGKTTKN